MTRGAKKQTGRAAPARVPDDLVDVVDPGLEDDADWNGIAVAGEVSGSNEVVDVRIVASTFRGVDLTGRRFDRLQAIDVEFDACGLAGVVFERCSFLRVTFRGCRMSGVVAAGLKGADVVFGECKMDGANFRMATLERAEFDRCALPESDFYGATLTGSRLVDCDVTDADFTKAKASGTALHRSTVAGVRGADGLRGVVISSDQIVPMSFLAFQALGIVIDDEDPAPDTNP